MAKKLTAIAVEKAKPGPKRIEIPDAGMPGLYLVVQPSGAKSWAYRYRYKGCPRKLTLGAGLQLAAARKLARNAAAAVAEGGDPAADKQTARHAEPELTVGDLVERYVDKHVKTLRSAGEVERTLRKELRGWWKRKAADIQRREAIALIDGIAERGTYMANRTLAYARAMYAWGLSKEVVQTSPFQAMKPREEQSRDRVLSPEELKAVWLAADRIGWPEAQVIKLLILTAARRDEIAGMYRDELNLAGRVWTLPGSRSKNGNAHVTPLSDMAVAILAPHVRNKAGLVFTRDGRPIGGWSKAKARLDQHVANILGKEPERWTLHDLRRTAATMMAEELKIAPHVIDKCLNHSTGVVRGVAAIYNRSELIEERKAALQAWGQYVDQLASGAPTTTLRPIHVPKGRAS